MSAPITPRHWQKYGADQCVSIARAGADRALVYACPGSGKTFGGLFIARELITRLQAPNCLIVITPNIAIKSQWIKTAAQLGIELREIDDSAELLQSMLPMGINGLILNYQQAVNMRLSLRVFCETHRPIAILDEVHHTAGSVPDRDGNAWGHAVELALIDTMTPESKEALLAGALVSLFQTGEYSKRSTLEELFAKEARAIAGEAVRLEMEKPENRQRVVDMVVGAWNKVMEDPERHEKALNRMADALTDALVTKEYR